MAPIPDQSGHLQGTWALRAYYLAGPGGTEPQYPLGVDARGQLTYSPGGLMSVQIQASRRPLYVDESVHGGTVDERAQAAGGYLAYAGSYEIRDDTVIHQPTVSLFPNWVNRPIVRRFEIVGDELTLSLVTPIIQDGQTTDGVLVWTRHSAPLNGAAL